MKLRYICIHTYVHTYIHTYFLTVIFTYTEMYKCVYIMYRYMCVYTRAHMRTVSPSPAVQGSSLCRQGRGPLAGSEPAAVSRSAFGMPFREPDSFFLFVQLWSGEGSFVFLRT